MQYNILVSSSFYYTDKINVVSHTLDFEEYLYKSILILNYYYSQYINYLL